MGEVRYSGGKVKFQKIPLRNAESLFVERKMIKLLCMLYEL